MIAEKSAWVHCLVGCQPSGYNGIQICRSKHTVHFDQTCPSLRKTLPCRAVWSCHLYFFSLMLGVYWHFRLIGLCKLFVALRSFSPRKLNVKCKVVAWRSLSVMADIHFFHLNKMIEGLERRLSAYTSVITTLNNNVSRAHAFYTLMCVIPLLML